jgi:acyl-homoserine lactone acylase PvdQ
MVIIGLVVSFGAKAARGATGKRGKVELTRDRWGVPHVFAETDAGAMYGLGYATAEDRAFQMHYSLRIIQGRLAEVIGDVKKARRNETAVQNDRKMRTFGFARAADRLTQSLDTESVSLLKAYCDGVNAYFGSNRDKLHPLFERTGLEPEPWTVADCLLSWWHLAQFFATDGTRDLMYYRNLRDPSRRNQMAQMGRAGRGSRAARDQAGGRGRRDPRAEAQLKPLGPDDAAAVVKHSDVSPAWVKRTQAFLQEHGFRPEGQNTTGRGGATGPKFSHAWVADGKFTGSGSAVLVSMPQTPVANPSLLYEFHLQGKTFNARGIGVPGSPVILIGWNENVAWGMTALGADQADLFRLKTDREHPDQYQFDGQWRSMELVREEIKIKGGRSQKLLIRQTHLGPIVSEFSFARQGDPPVAMKRIPLCDTDRETIQGSLAMLRARTAREFLKALAGWRFPTANVVFGDRAGTIGYSAAGALPLRSPLAPEHGFAAHDGSASKYEWQAMIPHELVPHVIDPAAGYLFSGNHRPIQSFYQVPIGIRTGSMGDTLRSLRLRQLTEARSSMTARDVHDMFLDSVNPARQAIATVGYHLRDVLKRDLSEAASSALEYLEDWYAAGAKSSLDCPGAEVGTRINTMFRIVQSDLTTVYGGGDSGLSRFAKTINGRLARDPKANVSPSEQEFVDNALAHAWNDAQRTFGPDTTTWNEQARQQVTQRKLGYYASLDGFPSLDSEFDMNVPALRCVDGATVFSQGAQAYVQWVPLAAVDTARSLLPPGPSERPDSPMRTINMEDWAKGQLHPAPITRQAVDRIAQSTRTLSQ